MDFESAGKTALHYI